MRSWWQRTVSMGNFRGNAELFSITSSSVTSGEEVMFVGDKSSDLLSRNQRGDVSNRSVFAVAYKVIDILYR